LSDARKGSFSCITLAANKPDDIGLREVFGIWAKGGYFGAKFANLRLKMLLLLQD